MRTPEQIAAYIDNAKFWYVKKQQDTARLRLRSSVVGIQEQTITELRKARALILCLESEMNTLREQNLIADTLISMGFKDKSGYSPYVQPGYCNIDYVMI